MSASDDATRAPPKPEIAAHQCVHFWPVPFLADNASAELLDFRTTVVYEYLVFEIAKKDAAHRYDRNRKDDVSIIAALLINTVKQALELISPTKKFDAKANCERCICTLRICAYFMRWAKF